MPCRSTLTRGRGATAAVGMRKARQKNPSPSLRGEASQLLRGFAGSLLLPYSEVSGGGSLRLLWECHVVAVILEEPTCALHCACRRPLPRKPRTGGQGQVQDPIAHPWHWAMCEAQLLVPKAACPCREILLYWGAWATSSPGVLTPGTHRLLTLSSKAVSCSCLGSWHELGLFGQRCSF